MIVNDDTVVSAHVPMVRQTSKLDQSRTELWSRSEDRKASLTQSGNAVGSNQVIYKNPHIIYTGTYFEMLCILGLLFIVSIESA